jgi:hypothetical protein
VFKLKAIGEATEAEAIELDRELQAYLKGYLSRTREDQTQQAAKVVSEAAPVPAGREAMEERMAQESASMPPRDPYPALRGDEPPPPNAPSTRDDFEDDSIPF